jgi:7-keto-8-aminopelargonate synthetase-like enzyme
VATALASLRVLKGSPHLLRNLRKNAQILKDGLTGLGFPVMATPTPIIPIPLGNDEKVFRLAWALEDAGVFVNPIVPPAVSAESSLIRVTAMATHTEEELEFALDRFKLVGRRLGLI